MDIALGTALPVFLVGNAAFSLGLMEALVGEAATQLTSTRLEHLYQTLAQQPVRWPTGDAAVRGSGPSARMSAWNDASAIHWPPA